MNAPKPKSTTMNFSSDLATLARKHIWFLEQIHAHGATNLSSESVRRYQTLWLPLVAAHNDQVVLIPPPDIAWLWHCHRLAPTHYTAYCQHVFHRILDANPPFAVAFPESSTIHHTELETTMTLWNHSYPSESFFLSESTESVHPSEPLLGFDLLGSAQRQSTFLWHISNERFADNDFLKDGVDRYAKFLKLTPKATKLRMTLVPTYQIDLIWHTHMLASTRTYHSECIELMGTTMSHDDSHSDRTEGGVLHTAYNATRDLWHSEYGNDYAVEGAMYGGEPPKAYYSPSWTCSKWELDIRLSAITEMGASSTPQAPLKWAEVDGLTSDGSPAFIQTDGQTRQSIKRQPLKDNYILGRCNDVTGYYHIESREAHDIMLLRLSRMIGKCQHDLAFEESCCGRPFAIAALKKQLALMEDIQKVWRERRDAVQPIGATPTKQIRNVALNRDDGTWHYPGMLYYGGACGGAVAASCGAGCGHTTHHHSHTASGCSGGGGCTSHHTGGGCGGGGSACGGGGGCGGGGCGS